MSRFKPGQSGNPCGRPTGSRNKSTMLIQSIVDDLPALLEKTKQQALDGDTGAMRLILERALPTTKSTAPPVEIPGLEQAKTLTEKAFAVLSAIGRGEVPSDIGAQLLDIIATVARVLEVDELTKRIEALEAQQKESP